MIHFYFHNAALRYFTLKFCVIGLILIPLISVRAQLIMDESFENYSPGSLHNQGNWTVSSGYVAVSGDSFHVRNGLQGAHFLASQQTLVTNNTSFGGSEPGVTGIVYVDVWIRIFSISDKYFALSGYDLYGTSQKRSFVFEFNAPSGIQGDFQIYDGSSKLIMGQYQIGEWVRISAKVDYDRSVYQVVYNGKSAVTANFRENYTPTASGTRQAGIKEYHQLRINLGYDGAVGSVNAAIDDIYVGTDSIPGIIFDDPLITYTLSIEQPCIGAISVDPDLPEYPENTQLTATLTIPSGYVNLGWTGDLSGTDLIKSFSITHDMIIGAEVGIDSTNPPLQFTVTVTQPAFGAISLDPPGGNYYQYTTVTAILGLPAGYINAGWTGDLSGTENEKTFEVLNDMTIGAIVIPDTLPPTVYTVSTSTEFRNCCDGSNLRAGDIVEVRNGTYDTGGITVESSGTVDRYIIIRAQNVGGAILNGQSNFIFRNSSYVQLEGFDFRSSVYTAVKLEACTNIRITRNIFNLVETAGQNGKWVYIGGIWNNVNAPSHHNQIDHNLFENKHELGNFITIDGQHDPVNQVSQYDRIDYNHFRNIGPRAVNEMEAVRIGVSDLSLSSGFTIIEYNLFEDCDGDPEIISIKSCDDTIRYNTLKKCQGTLCLRSGNRNTVEGNFFLGIGKTGTGGIRLYGNDHQIFNNYFEGLTGSTWDAVLTLTNGDYDGENSGGLTSHWRIKRAKIMFNTLAGNAHNIEIGYTNSGDYTQPPRDVIMANNLVTGTENQLVNIISQPLNMTWLSNILFPQGTASTGIPVTPFQIIVTDPQLIYSDSLWRLQPGSPAIDSARGNFPLVVMDMDGQHRAQLKDIGADEYSSESIIHRPLTANDVGPFAGSVTNIIDTEISEPKTFPDNYKILSVYPNPFNATQRIYVKQPESATTRLMIFDLTGKRIATEIKRLAPGMYQWNAVNLATGTYFIILRGEKIYDVRKVILLK